MPSSSGVDEYNIELLPGSIRYCVFSDVRCVFTITFFVELYFPQVFSFGQFFEISRVHTKLLNSARPESIASRDEEVEIILKEKESQFGEISGFAHAIDADYRDDIRTWFRG